MQARAGWMKSMNQNLAAKNLANVGKDAEELSKQAAKVAGAIEGERKAFNQKVSDLAKAVADAAAGGDEAVIKTRLGELKATCADCHAKFRDK
jgi:cytochrome c556